MREVTVVDNNEYNYRDVVPQSCFHSSLHPS